MRPKPLAIGLPSILILACGPGEMAAQTPAAERQAAWTQHQRMAAASPFRALQWRAVGPKFQGGRIETFALHPTRPKTLYLGVGAGGVWKTTDAGQTWRPIFDDQSTNAIGSIAVDPQRPDIVWVGTGETHPSGTSFAGTGIFKSTDGGRTWRNTGLFDSHHIARVRIDPENPDTVYAGVMGHHRSRNEERGVFKTVDGGKSWQRVFYAGPSIGVVELAMDPFASKTLYAATWDRRGGGSAVHKTTDGGKTWQRLGKGLPAGKITGRISLDVARAKRDTLYVLLVNKQRSRSRGPGGAEVYRSTDGGASFTKTHERPLNTYVGWDFCDIRIAPDNAEELYVCGLRLMISKDGGKTFQRTREKITRLHPHLGTVLHLDMHEVLIDPNNPDRILLATDGGLFVSTNRAQSWLHLNNLPIGEFYTVTLDMKTPYRIWGGTQDNASLYGPSNYTVNSSNADPWRHVFLDRWAGGDGFATLPDPTDDNIVYFEHQNGDMRRKRMDGSVLSGRADKRIRPRSPRGEPRLRWAWNTPLLISHHAPKTLYTAAQRVFRSKDRGDRWQTISDELARRHILTLAESPKKPGLLYVGASPRAVHVTKDDGKTWQNVSKGLPRRTVTDVVASRHDERTVYVTLTGEGGDIFDPYIYRSADYGTTWQPIHRGLPLEPVRVLVEDTRRASTLYIGTDLGVYVSLDSGKSWSSLCRGIPPSPVFDMAMHPRELELVAATHGRSIYVLDVKTIGNRP